MSEIRTHTQLRPRLQRMFAQEVADCRVILPNACAAARSSQLQTTHAEYALAYRKVPTTGSAQRTRRSIVVTLAPVATAQQLLLAADQTDGRDLLNPWVLFALTCIADLGG